MNLTEICLEVLLLGRQPVTSVLENCLAADSEVDLLPNVLLPVGKQVYIAVRLILLRLHVLCSSNYLIKSISLTSV